MGHCKAGSRLAFSAYAGWQQGGRRVPSLPAHAGSSVPFSHRKAQVGCAAKNQSATDLCAK
eukprot:1159472-Pelagomonas_calceolata.AAC.10